MKKSFFLSLFVSIFLLISCSTSIDDSNSSNRGLVIAVTTGSSRNLSRAAVVPYTVTITVLSKNYNDSQTKQIANRGAESFTFDNVPVDAIISVTCEIKVGSTIVYVAKQDNVIVKKDITSVTLNLEKVLLNSFEFADADLSSLQNLIQDCEATEDGAPVIIFKNEVSDLSSVLPYLTQDKPCTLNFANMARKDFTSTDFIAGQDGVTNVILPPQSVVSITDADNNGTLDESVQSASSLLEVNGGTVKLTSGSVPVVLDAVTINDIGNSLPSVNVELSGNIVLEANDATSITTLPAKLAVLPEVKITGLTKYKDIVKAIHAKNNSLTVSKLTIVINQNDQEIPTTYNDTGGITDNGSQNYNIKELAITGSGTNIKIGRNAFRAWKGLQGKNVYICKNVSRLDQYVLSGIYDNDMTKLPIFVYDADDEWKWKKENDNTSVPCLIVYDTGGTIYVR